MRWVASLLAALAAMLILLPWEICTCGEDGPHLVLIGTDSECSSTPDSDDSDDESDCGALFTFDACFAANASALPHPSGPQGVELAGATTPGTCQPQVVDVRGVSAEPPDPGGPASPSTLTPRLLI